MLCAYMGTDMCRDMAHGYGRMLTSGGKAGCYQHDFSFPNTVDVLAGGTWSLSTSVFLKDLHFNFSSVFSDFKVWFVL